MKYTIKIWLFTALVSPLLILTLGACTNSPKLTEILISTQLLGVMILVGSFLSIPAMLLFWLIQRKLINTASGNKAKIILSVYSFISVWITFYIFDRGFVERGFQQMIWVIIYSLTIVIGVWIFKPVKSKKV